MTPGIARHIPLALAAVAIAAPFAPAQTAPPDYGHDFVTIGAPGNRPFTPEEAPDWMFDRYGAIGAVEDEYRITRTEVTYAQFVEFVNAYIPVPGSDLDDGVLIGTGLTIDYIDPRGFIVWKPWYGAEDAPAVCSWRYAARYANWLHNGKGTELADFETGVYDASTFGEDPVTGVITDQLERSPGATFFLPTYDEWVKAVYYDPDRYGEGLEGYWYHPDGGNEPLVSGEPGEPGAETSGGERPPTALWLFPVGSYPDTVTPWGLLDASGGEEEWTETVLLDGDSLRRREKGGSRTIPDTTYMWNDRLDQSQGGGIPFSSSAGFRLASLAAVPCPADLDGDGTVTLADFLLLADAFDAGEDRADLDGDDALTLLDFLVFQNMFEEGC